MYTNQRKHTYDERYQYIRDARNTFENSSTTNSNVMKWIFFRFTIAAILFLSFLLITQFPDVFPDGISKQIYHQIMNNDLYTKLQNYVIMLLYDN